MMTIEDNEDDVDQDGEDERENDSMALGGFREEDERLKQMKRFVAIAFAEGVHIH